ncbi:MAG: hypothetical protein V5A43_00285 [Haloarculaceae archaeon]
MTPDLDSPMAPDVPNRQVPAEIDEIDLDLEDLRRGGIETVLREGAWQEGFQKWAAYVDVDEDLLGVVSERELFQEFDFYDDPKSDRIRANPPALPEDWLGETDSPGVAALRTALDDLGEIVADTLVTDYLD